MQPSRKQDRRLIAFPKPLIRDIDFIEHRSTKGPASFDTDDVDELLFTGLAVAVEVTLESNGWRR